MAAPLLGPIDERTGFEETVDRWASYGALALAAVVGAVFALFEWIRA